ncbi:MAG: hypothetical protein OXP08_09915, partial [bacterium]|nr:hypothetical protein [bacterium]
VTAVAVGRLHRRLGGRGDATLKPPGTPVAVGRLHRRPAVHGGAALPEISRMVLRGQLAAGRHAAVALRRAWLPLLGAAASWPWGRRLALAALVVEPLATWLTRRPALGPLRWTAATLLSDAAYCAGVWRGALAAHSAAALRPRLIRTMGSPADERAGAPDLGSRPSPG